MSRIIRVSDRDLENLQRLRKLAPPSAPEQPEDYRGKVVLKPWGFEFLAFENEYVAMWCLHIRGGHSTSMHCHPRKKTSLVVLQGEALCNTFYRRNYLTAPEAVVLEAGVFHSTKAMNPEGITLLELESPPDKTDLMRLNDQYGRETSGYEGLSEMKTEGLHRYGYFRFEEPEEELGEPQAVAGRLLRLQRLPGSRQVAVPDRAEVLCAVCRGHLQDPAGNSLLCVGDAIDGAGLREASPLVTAGPTLLLTISPLE